MRNLIYASTWKHPHGRGDDRRLTRPVLTFAFVGLTAAVYATAAADLQDLVGRAVVAMTATAVAWWFSDRAIAKRVAGRLL